MRVYEKFAEHEHNFNVAVLTILSMLASMGAGALLIAMGVLETKYFWVVLAVALVVFPVIVFITSDGNTEFKTAYYKTLRDIITGKIDQKKIIRSFARKYKIKNYRIKPENIEVDGRWNFRADTKYMRTIIYQRNLLLDELSKEYNDARTAAVKRVISSEKEHSDRVSDLNAISSFEENAKNLEKMSKIAAEKYFYREKRDEKIIQRLEAENKVHEALRQLGISKKNCENLDEEYRITVSQINKIYNERYVKYTETAIKKLNRIHRLKYRIADMSEVEKGV